MPAHEGDPGRRAYDVVIVGGGHNGLVAAAYLARAGRSVLVLERLDHTGGAAVSTRPFTGVDARLSRYSYLVSLLPSKIVRDLGLDFRVQRRTISSYTPVERDGRATGLLVGGGEARTREAFARLTGGEREYEAWQRFYGMTGRLAERVFPTLTEPLPTREELRRRVDDEEAWRALFEEPVGVAVEEHFTDDLVRGVVLTDALIGTFARTDESSLAQNVCFLYHLVGGGTGDWDVPIGGMGAVSGALEAAASRYGAEIVTGAEVFAVTPDGDVSYRDTSGEHRVHGGVVLAGVTPTVLAGLLGETAPDSAPGSQVKVNLMLSRLPRLRDDSVRPEQAFGGTFHVNETLSQLDSAYDAAAAGSIPDPLPCEIYCHSLSDPSILSDDLRRSGAQTLTVFGLHTPHHLGASSRTLTDAVFESLNAVLAEPIQDVILTDRHGAPCIETKTTADLQDTLGMTAGHIFHGGLSWPFTDDDDPLDTPARRWGVATGHDRIMLCGSGSRRGGAVSGIGGHNAAMAVLEGFR